MTTPATSADVIALGSLYGDDFSSLSSTVVDIALAYAGAMLSADSWGSKYTSGHASLTAHVLKAASGGSTGAQGAVTSRSVDKISESYAVPGMGTSDAELASTRYGTIHIALRRTLVASVSFSEPSDGWDLPDGRIL